MGKILRKKFKTINEQLDILEKRGLHINDVSQAKLLLKQHGYYSLINGYKLLFLRKNINGKVIHPEEFKYGTSFDEIVTLYSFDFNLRTILYKALIKYETMLGSEIAYRFSEHFRDEHAYLAIDNYSREPQKTSSVVGTISSLSTTIKNYCNRYGDNAIKHYVSKYGSVPLWVLVNFLTFGDLNYFYTNCFSEIQKIIAKDFHDLKAYTYENKHQAAITPSAICQINKMVNIFRNAVAHGEITYSKRIWKTPSLGEIKSAANINEVQLHSQAGIFELMIAMKAVLPKDNYLELIKNIHLLFEEAKQSFSYADYLELLEEMHFPVNYLEILNNFVGKE